MDAQDTTMFDTLTTLSLSCGAITRASAGRYVQEVSITNVGSKAVKGPIRLVLVNPAEGTVLTNATGTTKGAPKGSPYVTILPEGKLGPNQTATVKLKFNPPAIGGLGYDLQTVINTDRP